MSDRLYVGPRPVPYEDFWDVVATEQTVDDLRAAIRALAVSSFMKVFLAPGIPMLKVWRVWDRMYRDAEVDYGPRDASWYLNWRPE